VPLLSSNLPVAPEGIGFTEQVRVVLGLTMSPRASTVPPVDGRAPNAFLICTHGSAPPNCVASKKLGEFVVFLTCILNHSILTCLSNQGFGCNHRDQEQAHCEKTV